MRVIEITSFGTPDVLQAGTRPDPVPTVGEVLIHGIITPGAVAKTDGLAQAAALAEKF